MKRLPTLLVPLLVLCLAMPASATPPFRKGKVYTVGQEPQSVIVADFNNDGILDLATVDFTSLDVSILLGKGDGTFKAPHQFSTTLDPSALAAGDFNGDGNLDLAVVEYALGPSSLAIFLGNGDGSFTPGPVYKSVSLPYDVTVADFNGDGHLDLAVASNGSNKVGIFFGNGDGTFQRPVNYHAPLPERVLAVDLNKDGHPDLAILAYCGPHPKTCASGAVEVLLNQGNGTFGPPRYFIIHGTGPDGIATADFNHDGNTDLAVANNNFQQPSVVSVLLGSGDGTFKPAKNYDVGSGPAGIAVADFNGDGNLDLAVANTGSNNVSLLFGKADGAFGPAKNITFATGSLPIDVAVAGVNKDNAPNLAVVLDYANEVAILLNTR